MSGVQPLVNIEAEAALLGAIMLDETCFDGAAEILGADDFAEPAHVVIWSAIAKFRAAGRKPTAVTLRPVVDRDPALKNLGGADYLGQLVETPGVVSAARDFAEQIRDLASRRVARAAHLDAASRMEGDFDASVGEISGDAEAASTAAAARTAATTPRSAGDAVMGTSRRAEEISQGGRRGASCRLIPELDATLGPLEAGQYVILAGRPGMGKSVVASSAGIGYAMNGTPVCHIHAEMSAEQQNLRSTADLSLALGRPLKTDLLRKGNLERNDYRQLQHIAEQADLLPIRWEEAQGASFRRIRAIVRRHKALWAARGKKLGIVIVDYLGLFEVEIDGRLVTDDRPRVNAISRELRLIADTEDVAVIALAQLSRAVEARADKRPQLSDLRDSGNLEQDADAVLFVYRAEYYLESSEPRPGERDARQGSRDLHEEWETEMLAAKGKVDIIAGKNRWGSRITRTATFHGAYSAARAGGFLIEDAQDALDLDFNTL